MNAQFRAKMTLFGISEETALAIMDEEGDIHSPSPFSPPGPLTMARKRSLSPHPIQSTSYSSSSASDSKVDVKGLAAAYKRKALSRFHNLSKSSVMKSKIMVNIGGMLYDPDIQKGIRKKSLPEPNPSKIEVDSTSDFLAMQMKAKELYFQEYMTLAKDLVMGDSSGVPIIVSDIKTWTVGDFYQSHGFQPSRYKMYFMLNLKTEIELLENTTERSTAASSSKLQETEPVINNCVDCGFPFRTYVPNTCCKLPDGGFMTRWEPQLQCPECDPNRYGLFMNQDLFPHLCPSVGTIQIESDTDVQ